MKRQDEEKREIENRLREKLRKQQEEQEEEKGGASGLDSGTPNQKNGGTSYNENNGGAAGDADTEEMYNDAPTYYQPSIIPQNPLSPENQELQDEFI